VDGALLLAPAGNGFLVVSRKASWTSRVAPALKKASQSATYARLAISPEERRAPSASCSVAVQRPETGGSADASSGRLYANILLGVGLIVLFNGFAALFAGITGEKQQCITAQMFRHDRRRGRAAVRQGAHDGRDVSPGASSVSGPHPLHQGTP